jgi:Protein of unknown function (DUF4235)
MIGHPAWKVLSGTAVVVATMAVEKGLQVGWQAVTGKKPPAVPENPHSTWRKPLVWSMVSGALVGATRVFATRATARYYEHSAGHLPTAIRTKVHAAEKAATPDSKT